jgi:hypothetical protein
MRRNWFLVVFAVLFATFIGGGATPAFADCVIGTGANDNASCAVAGGAPSNATAPSTGTYRPEGGVLYDNGPLYNVPGSPAFSELQDASLTMNTFGFGVNPGSSTRLADDFTIPAGETWTITGAEVFGYQTGSTTTSTFTAVNLRIWEGTPGTGTIVFGDTTTNRLASTTWDNGYRSLESAPGATNRPIMRTTATVSATLDAGTYWLDWQLAGSLASGPFGPPITIEGQNTTGNGLNFSGGSWIAANDTGSLTPQGLPFRILGTGGGGDGITLEKTVGTTSGTCATTDTINVTIGTDVFYCYEVTNDTQITLSLHTLDDTVLGNVFENFAYDLGPGESVSTVDAGLVISSTITTDTVNEATWTAFNPITYGVETGTCSVFPDISTTGTALNLGDDSVADITLPFSFGFYSVNTTLASVSNNGVVTFGASGTGVFTNEPLPSISIPNSHAAYWDDLDEETGNVYHGPYTLPGPIGSLVPEGATSFYAVQWDDRSHFPGPSASTATVTALYAAPGQGADGLIITCYNDTDFDDPSLDFGASATLGLNEDETNALQYSFNTPNPALTGTFGIAYEPLGGGEVYTATDVATVTVTGPEINVTPAALSETHSPSGQITTDTLTIQNTGDQPLTYTIFEEETTLPNIAGNGVPQGTDVTIRERESYIKNPPAPNAFGAARGTNLMTTRFYESGALPATPLGASVNLTLDDGIAEDAIGLTAGGQFIWLNRFTPAPTDFPFTLTEIQLQTTSVSNCAATDTIDFYVWSDADGNPANGATFMGSLTGQQVGTLDQFNSYPTNIDVTGSGDVLIAVVNRTCTAAGAFPAAIDTTASQVRSWVGLYNGTPGNPPTLPADNTFATIDSLGFAGNWLIRGIGASGCQAANDIPWLTLSGTSGTIAGGGSNNVSVVYNSTGLANGTYTGNLCVESSDFDESLTVVPVVLTVTGPTAIDLTTIGTAGNTTPIVLFAAAGMFLLAAAGFVMRRK